ncbi:MAG: SWIB/MDM2 domain-containing protein [Sphingomonas adhaesiva]|uniref:SWIB/MDM2 domain-containing protein n=1 Tax=Sphingomonas adhaesiva TaxID=28212 RepID=UPI002FF8AB3F
MATKTKADAAAPKKAKADAAAAPKTGGIHAPVQPSAELGAVVGNEKLPRSQVISKVWEYIKSNNLQNPENKREILADDKLKKVFGKDKVTMFEMNKYISQHVKA